MRSAKRGAAIFMSLCLLWTSGNLAQAFAEAPPLLAKPLPLPQLELMPPGQFGRIADYFNAPVKNSKLVVLIQDLHAHYGVQKNIAEILEFLTTKLIKGGQSGIPFALAVEGAQGPVDTSVIARYPDKKIKQAALDYLMREGELTGMEYFAGMRGIPTLLVGVEDLRYYNAHRELFRQTLESRTQLVDMFRGIQADIKMLPTAYSPSLAAVHAKAEAYEKAELSTTEFINYLAGQATADDIRNLLALKNFIQNAASDANKADQLRQLTAEFLTQVADHLSAEERATLAVLAKKQGTSAYYGYLRDLIYQHQLFMAVPLELAKHLEYLHTAQTMGFDRVTYEAQELAFKIKMRAAQTSPERDLIQVEHDLALLLKISDLQATDYEVRSFGPRVNEFVALCNSMLKSHGLKTFDDGKIRELISTSIDYYVMALMRNKPMVDHTLDLLKEPGKAGVLVTGGYHTAMLTQLLRERNVSYVVITPMVDQISEKDHELYVKRLTGVHLTTEEVARAAQGANFLFQGYFPSIRDSFFGTFVHVAEGMRRAYRGLAVPAGSHFSRWLPAWLKRQSGQKVQVGMAEPAGESNSHRLNWVLNVVLSWFATGGGALKRLGSRDQTDQKALSNLQGRHAEFEEAAKEAKVEEVDDLSLKRIYADLPPGVYAYHLHGSDGTLIIVLNPSLPASARDEAIYHEIREAYWMSQGFNQHEAHVLASAEQILRFGSPNRLTPYHQTQIEDMTPDQLQALASESEQDRRWHHDILRRAGLNVQHVQSYENMLRMQAARQRIKLIAFSRQVDPVFQFKETKDSNPLPFRSVLGGETPYGTPEYYERVAQSNFEFEVLETLPDGSKILLARGKGFHKGNLFIVSLNAQGKVVGVAAPTLKPESDTGKDYHFRGVDDAKLLQQFEGHLAQTNLDTLKPFNPAPGMAFMRNLMSPDEIEAFKQMALRNPILRHLIVYLADHDPDRLIRLTNVFRVAKAEAGGFYFSWDHVVVVKAGYENPEEVYAHEIAHFIHIALLDSDPAVQKLLAEHFDQAHYRALFSYLERQKLYHGKILPALRNARGLITSTHIKEALARFMGALAEGKVIDGPSGYHLTFGDIRLLIRLGFLPARYADLIDPQIADDVPLPLDFVSAMETGRVTDPRINNADQLDDYLKASRDDVRATGAYILALQRHGLISQEAVDEFLKRHMPQWIDALENHQNSDSLLTLIMMLGLSPAHDNDLQRYVQQLASDLKDSSKLEDLGNAFALPVFPVELLLNALERTGHSQPALAELFQDLISHLESPMSMPDMYSIRWIKNLFLRNGAPSRFYGLYNIARLLGRDEQALGHLKDAIADENPVDMAERGGNFREALEGNDDDNWLRKLMQNPKATGLWGQKPGQRAINFGQYLKPAPEQPRIDWVKAALEPSLKQTINNDIKKYRIDDKPQQIRLYWWIRYPRLGKFVRWLHLLFSSFRLLGVSGVPARITKHDLAWYIQRKGAKVLHVHQGNIPDVWYVPGYGVVYHSHARPFIPTEYLELRRLAPHSYVNNYVKNQLPNDLIEDPTSNKEKYRDPISGAIVIPIKGLYRKTGQFGHIGLGQVYGEPVIYIDADLSEEARQTVMAHELYEIGKWEDFRTGELAQRLGRTLSPGEMRQWIKDNFDEALALAEGWHMEAPSITHLFKKAGVVHIEDFWGYFHDEQDINLAAGRSDNAESGDDDHLAGLGNPNLQRRDPDVHRLEMILSRLLAACTGANYAMPNDLVTDIMRLDQYARQNGSEGARLLLSLGLPLVAVAVVNQQRYQGIAREFMQPVQRIMQMDPDFEHEVYQQLLALADPNLQVLPRYPSVTLQDRFHRESGGPNYYLAGVIRLLEDLHWSYHLYPERWVANVTIDATIPQAFERLLQSLPGAEHDFDYMRENPQGREQWARFEERAGRSKEIFRLRNVIREILTDLQGRRRLVSEAGPGDKPGARQPLAIQPPAETASDSSGGMNIPAKKPGIGRAGIWGRIRRLFLRSPGSEQDGGGALKRMGRRDVKDEEALVSLKSRHRDFEKQAQQDIDAGRARWEESDSQRVQVIDAALPATIAAYHVPRAQGPPLVVLSHGLPANLYTEAIYHEVREAYWIAKGYSQHAAHVIASAEQAARFATSGGITPYHEYQLNQLSAAGLKSIVEEIQRHRAEHHEVLKHAWQDTEAARVYEARVRDRARDILRQKWGVDVPSEDALSALKPSRIRIVSRAADEPEPVYLNRPYQDPQRRVRDFLTRMGADFGRLSSPQKAQFVLGTKGAQYRRRKARLVQKAQDLALRLNKPVGIHVMPSQHLPLLGRETFWGHAFVIDPEEMRKLNIDKDPNAARKFVEAFIYRFFDTFGFGLQTKDGQPSVPITLFFGETGAKMNGYAPGQLDYGFGISPQRLEETLLGLIHWKFPEVNGKANTDIELTIAERYLDKLLEIANQQSSSQSTPPVVPHQAADQRSSAKLEEGPQQPGSSIASLSYWIVLAVTGDAGRAARWGSGGLGHRLERIVGVLGGTVAAVIAPALWWIPIAFWGGHLIVQGLIAMGLTRAPPALGRRALRWPSLRSQFAILASYGLPALVARFLDLPLELGLPLVALGIISATILAIVAQIHGRYDQRLLTKAMVGDLTNPLTPLDRIGDLFLVKAKRTDRLLEEAWQTAAPHLADIAQQLTEEESEYFTAIVQGLRYLAGQGQTRAARTAGQNALLKIGRLALDRPWMAPTAFEAMNPIGFKNKATAQALQSDLYAKARTILAAPQGSDLRTLAGALEVISQAADTDRFRGDALEFVNNHWELAFQIYKDTGARFKPSNRENSWDSRLRLALFKFVWGEPFDHEPDGDEVAVRLNVSKWQRTLDRIVLLYQATPDMDDQAHIVEEMKFLYVYREHELAPTQRSQWISAMARMDGGVSPAQLQLLEKMVENGKRLQPEDRILALSLMEGIQAPSDFFGFEALGYGAEDRQWLTDVMHDEKIAIPLRLAAWGALVAYHNNRSLPPAEFQAAIKRMTEEMSRLPEDSEFVRDMYRSPVARYKLAAYSLAALLEGFYAGESAYAESPYRVFESAKQIMNARVKRNSNKADETFEFGGRLMRPLGGREFMMVVHHELMHHVLSNEYQVPYNTPNTEAIQECLCDWNALEQGRRLGWPLERFIRVFFYPLHEKTRQQIDVWRSDRYRVARTQIQLIREALAPLTGRDPEATAHFQQIALELLRPENPLNANYRRDFHEWMEAALIQYAKQYLGRTLDQLSENPMSARPADNAAIRLVSQARIAEILGLAKEDQSVKAAFPKTPQPPAPASGGSESDAKAENNTAMSQQILPSARNLLDEIDARQKTQPQGYKTVSEILGSARINDILAQIPVGSEFLGIGTSAVALKIPDGKVMRIGRRIERPKVRGVLQAEMTMIFGDYQIEWLPLGQTEGITPEHYKQVDDLLHEQGYVLAEWKPGNIALFNGVPMVIDPGSAVPIMDFEPHRQVFLRSPATPLAMAIHALATDSQEFFDENLTGFKFALYRFPERAEAAETEIAKYSFPDALKAGLTAMIAEAKARATRQAAQREQGLGPSARTLANGDSAEENFGELWDEGHWLDALGLAWGAASWFMHVKIFRQEMRPVNPGIELAIRTVLMDEQHITAVKVRSGAPGRHLAGARVHLDPVTGIATVEINPYAPFKANVRGAIHETEHLKNPTEIGKAEEETRIIRKSYEMMNRLDAMVKDHQNKTLKGIQDGAQVEQLAPRPQVKDVEASDTILAHLLPIWHIHKEQSLVNRTRELVIGTAA